MPSYIKNKKFISLLIFLFVIHVLFFVFADRLSRKYHRVDAATPLQLINGTKSSIGDYHGKPVLVHFWATSCKTCISEMPQLKKLYNRLQPKGFELLAVAMPYDRPDIVIAYADKMTMLWPVVLDVRGNTLSAFGRVQATPTSFLLDQQGNVVFKHVGKLDIVSLEQRINSLLKTGS